MTVVLVVGTTRTARIDGISAAGADPATARYTPAADAEIVAEGRPLLAPGVPVSPDGCPTPALVTRTIRELVGFDLLVIDAGLAVPTGAPTTDLGAAPGGDIREPEPVPDAAQIVAAARDVGAGLPADAILVGESIPGGTTTALGVLRALGEPHGVSSSQVENPIERKRAIVETGLAASGLTVGGARADPVRALEAMGDPVLGAIAGVVEGAISSGTSVTLAGGTQLVAAAALARHGGLSGALTLTTTPFVATDETADIRSAATALDLELVVTDPRFDRSDHPAMVAYCRGEAKEGVAMGGALRLAALSGIPMAAVRDRIAVRYEQLIERPRA